MTKPCATHLTVHALAGQAARDSTLPSLVCLLVSECTCADGVLVSAPARNAQTLLSRPAEAAMQVPKHGSTMLDELTLEARSRVSEGCMTCMAFLLDMFGSRCSKLSRVEFGMWDISSYGSRGCCSLCSQASPDSAVICVDFARVASPRQGSLCAELICTEYTQDMCECRCRAYLH